MGLLWSVVYCLWSAMEPIHSIPDDERNDLQREI